MQNQNYILSISSFIKNKQHLLSFLPIFWFASIPLGNSLRSILMLASLIFLFSSPHFLHKLKTYLHTPWFYALCAAMSWSYASIFWAPGIEGQSLFYLKKLSTLWLIPLFIPAFSSRIDKDLSLNLFLISMLIPFVLSLFKYYGGWTWHHDSDPGLLFYNHIITGFYAAFAAFLGLELFFKHQRLYYLIAWGLFSFQVLFINTGKAAYGIYLILMAYCLWPKTQWKHKFFLILGGCLSFILLTKISHSIQNNIISLMHEFEAFKQHQFDTSLGFRIQFHHFAYTLFKQHWLTGGGLGAYDHWFDKLHPVPAWPYKPNTHSQYWFFASDLGLIGLSLWLIFFGILAKTTRLNDQGYGRIFNGFLLILTINFFTDNMLFASPVHLLIGLWAIAQPINSNTD
jgi:O-antigen ligase